MLIPNREVFHEQFVIIHAGYIPILGSVQDVMYYDIALATVGAQAEDVYVLVLLNPTRFATSAIPPPKENVFRNAM